MILKRPKAIHSIHQQIDWFIEESPELALKFIESIETSFTLLEANHEIGRPLNSMNPRLSEVRIWHISDFPKHLVFYIPILDGIEVIDLIHGARDLIGILDEID